MRARLAAALFAFPACADPAPAADMAGAPGMADALDACLAAAPDRAAEEACIGVPSAPCPDADPTAVGMTSRLLDEAAAWDARLDALRPDLRARAARLDATGEAVAAGLPGESETLLAAQRAWLAFRDAECAWRCARWGIGSMRRLAGAACRRDLVADRVLAFRDLLREAR